MPALPATVSCRADPLNPEPNGEILSPNVTPSFGVPGITTFYDDNWAFGWGNRFVTGTVTVPMHDMLPDGGGNTLSSYDLLPASVRPADEIRVDAGNFADQSEVRHGFDFTVDAGMQDLLLQGGVSHGGVSYDYCNLQSALPESVGNLSPSGAAAIPQRSDFGDSSPLEYCNRGENWLTQLDLCLTKIFRFAGGMQVRAMFDVFNVFNANAVTLEQPGFGAQWLAPQAIMPGRLARFAFQLDF